MLGDTSNLLATARVDVPSWRSWTIWATSAGLRNRLMLPVVIMTLAKANTSGKPVKEIKREKWPPHAKPVLFWGSSHCCPSSAPVVNSINTNASTPMHLKLINNPLCYLTDHIIIREVQLKSCHTLIKKCSFNFFEQCMFVYMSVGVCIDVYAYM